MDGSFEIEIDRFNAMLVSTGRGFWSVSTVREYLAAERDAISSLGVKVRDLLILFDASEFAVQRQEVIALLQRPEHPLYNARRAAFVTPKGLRMLQIKRGTPDEHIRIFETQEEARQYLLAD